MPDLSPKARFARLLVSLLRVLGLRENANRWRHSRARARRRALTPDDPAAWPGLHGMDRKLNDIIDIDDGFFVEAGANDGYTQSNTYWLERFRGWRGLLVEPMSELYEFCRLERPAATVVRAALVSYDYAEGTVTMRFGDLMSTVIGSHEVHERTEFGNALGIYDAHTEEVPARTLSALLDEIGAPEVDLLSLDVEGFEPTALAGIDFERHAPRWILVEVHDEGSGRPPIEAVLGDRYVFGQRLSPTDLLYRRAAVGADRADAATT